MDEVELLQFRASFGTWYRKRTWTKILERDVTIQEDIRRYSVEVYDGRPYTRNRTYNVNEFDAKNIIARLKREQYRLVTLQYPELELHFRNGEPITLMTELDEELKKLPVKEKDTRTGLEILFDNWKIIVDK